MLKDNYDPNGIMFDFENKKQRPDRVIRFYKEECSKYEHVIEVGGNHTFYGDKWHKSIPHIKSLIPDNVHFLEKEIFAIGDTIFIGAILWTDINKGNPISMNIVESFMTDYSAITYHNTASNTYYKLKPSVTYDDHFKALAYFRLMCSQHRDKKIVIVSHHAPSHLSIDPVYAGQELNYAYYSDLSDFILDNENIKFWVCGHTHHSYEYKIGETTVLCNSRGYFGHETQAKNFKLKSFEV